MLWDFDGTVANTEPVWIASQIEVMASYGVPYAYEQAVKLCGVSAAVSIRALFDAHEEVHGEPPQIEGPELWQQIVDGVIQRIKEEPLPWLPGARELLIELHAKGVPMALVWPARAT